MPEHTRSQRPRLASLICANVRMHLQPYKSKRHYVALLLNQCAPTLIGHMKPCLVGMLNESCYNDRHRARAETLSCTLQSVVLLYMISALRQSCKARPHSVMRSSAEPQLLGGCPLRVRHSISHCTLDHAKLSRKHMLWIATSEALRPVRSCFTRVTIVRATLPWHTGSSHSVSDGKSDQEHGLRNASEREVESRTPRDKLASFATLLKHASVAVLTPRSAVWFGAPRINFVAPRYESCADSCGTLCHTWLLGTGRPFLARTSTRIGSTCTTRRDEADPGGPKARRPFWIYGRGCERHGSSARQLEKGCPTCVLTPASRPPLRWPV